MLKERRHKRKVKKQLRMITKHYTAVKPLRRHDRVK
jgi:hypothetical protein